MAVILFLSQGVPMLVAGDEFGRTQQGNNNAWCQDNEISWLDWQLAEENKDLLRFFKKLIRLRRGHPIFRRSDFFTGTPDTNQLPRGQEIHWQGLNPDEEDWSYNCHTLGFLLKGCELPKENDCDFFVMLNGHRQQAVTFITPQPGSPQSGAIWKKIIDTSQPAPADFVGPGQAEKIVARGRVTVSAMGCIVLQSMGGKK